MAIGRVFNLTKTDTTIDSTVIAGTLLVQDILMHALINSGGTNSFISCTTINSIMGIMFVTDLSYVRMLGHNKGNYVLNRFEEENDCNTIVGDEELVEEDDRERQHGHVEPPFRKKPARGLVCELSV